MTRSVQGATLADLGEFAVLERVIFPAAHRWQTDNGLGDDCGFMEIGGTLLAVSADVGPRPLVHQLPGYEHDFEAAGWHAVVTTASDIASAAARPLFLVDTIDAPADMRVAELDQFVEGYFRASSTFGFQTLGGDLRQGSTLSARVFGVGNVTHGRRIGRTGARPGDHLVLLGDAGEFIAAFLHGERLGVSTLDAASLERLRFPRPQSREMQALAAHGLVVAASDSSDGVLGAIENIAKRSACAFELVLQDELISVTVMEEAKARELDPWNLFFFWGDWSVAAVIPKHMFMTFEHVTADANVRWLPLGQAIEGPPRIDAIVGGVPRSVRPLRNENFVPRSFNAGVRSHVEEMLNTELFSNRGLGST